MSATLPLEVAVIDDDPKLRTRLAMQLGETVHAGSYASLAAVEEKKEDGAPFVMLLGPSYAEEHRLLEVTQLLRRRTSVSAIVVADDVSTVLLRQAIRAGVSDVIDLGGDGSQLLEAVERAAEEIMPRAGTPAVEAPAPSPVGPRGRVTTIFSTKGGAGKSVMACNLGVLLARKTSRPVVLLDADLQFGDVAVMLRLQAQHTIVDAVNAIDRLDLNLLKSFLIKHEQSGLWVLAAPLEPAFADQVSPGDMHKIIELLLDFAGHVVVDTPAYFNEVVLGLLEASDDIVLVAGMDIPHIKNTKIGLQTLRLLNVPASKLRLLLNRANSKVKLDVAEVERTLQLKADIRVPSDIAVPQSVNKAVPVVLDAPRSGVTKALETFADEIIAEAEKVARAAATSR